MHLCSIHHRVLFFSFQDDEWLAKLPYIAAELPLRLGLWQDEMRHESLAQSGSISEWESTSYNVIMSSLSNVLTELELKTLRRHPRNLNERSFLRRFRGNLQSLLRAFRTPIFSKRAANVDAPLLIDHCRNLCAQISTEMASSCNIKLASVTKVLSDWHKNSTTRIWIPGMPSLCRLGRISNDITVLRTKTRPKKLDMIGSDGRSFPFLLKAREDLHLDQRILQSLSLVNKLLKHDYFAGKRSPISMPLGACVYEVVPLSKSSALIRMVDSVVSLYTLYMRDNQTNVGRDPSPSKPSSDNALSAPERGETPSAHFYRLIRAELAMAPGLSSSSSRRSWPKSIVRRVFQKLCASTRKHIITQSLWSESHDPVDAWARRRRFCASAAVMSMFGHVIGLGDRHLGNLCLDTDNGKLVHIDFNIAFDAGKKLAVPELVPFRLTSIVRDPMLLLPFNECCEHVVDCMRRYGIALETIFSAFVLAPLLEWRESHSHVTRNHKDCQMATQVCSRRIQRHIKRQKHITISEDVHSLLLTISNLAPRLDTALSKAFSRNELCDGDGDGHDGLMDPIKRILGSGERKIIVEANARIWRDIRPLVSILEKTASRPSPLQSAASTLKSSWDNLLRTLLSARRIALSEAMAQIPIERVGDDFAVTFTELVTKVNHALNTFCDIVKDPLIRIDLGVDVDTESNSKPSSPAVNKAHEVLRSVREKIHGGAIPTRQFVQNVINEALDANRIADMYEGKNSVFVCVCVSSFPIDIIRLGWLDLVVGTQTLSCFELDCPRPFVHGENGVVKPFF